MGARKRRSSDQIRARALEPQDDRETLRPCPACEGEKTIMREMAGGRYSLKACRWCDGQGYVTNPIHAMYLRWLRIYNVNYRHCQGNGKH